MNTCISTLRHALPLLAIVGAAAFVAQQGGYQDVIVRIGQNEITREMIQPSDYQREIIQERYKDPLIQQSARKRLLAQELARQMRRVVEKRAIDRLNIRVAQEEVQQEIDSRFKNSGFGQDRAKVIVQTSRKLADALEKWIKTGDNPTKIYTDMLSNTGLNRDQWASFRRRYNTLKDVARFRKSIPSDLNSMKAYSSASARNDLLMHKLRSSVAEVDVTRKDVQTAYKNKYDGKPSNLRPDLADVYHRIQKQVKSKKQDAAMKRWYADQFKEIPITILDERFRSTVETLRGTISTSGN